MDNKCSRKIKINHYNRSTYSNLTQSYKYFAYLFIFFLFSLILTSTVSGSISNSQLITQPTEPHHSPNQLIVVTMNGELHFLDLPTGQLEATFFMDHYTSNDLFTASFLEEPTLPLVPSMNGNLYTWHGYYLSPYSEITNNDQHILTSIQTRTYALSSADEQIYYSCSKDGCDTSRTNPQSESQNKDIFLFTRHSMTSRSINKTTGQERWNVTIVIPTIERIHTGSALESNSECDTSHFDDATTRPLELDYLNNLLNYNSDSFNGGWQFKFTAHINAIWHYEHSCLRQLNLIDLASISKSFDFNSDYLLARFNHHWYMQPLRTSNHYPSPSHDKFNRSICSLKDQTPNQDKNDRIRFKTLNGDAILIDETNADETIASLLVGYDSHSQLVTDNSQTSELEATSDNPSSHSDVSSDLYSTLIFNYLDLELSSNVARLELLSDTEQPLQHNIKIQSIKSHGPIGTAVYVDVDQSNHNKKSNQDLNASAQPDQYCDTNNVILNTELSRSAVVVSICAVVFCVACCSGTIIFHYYFYSKNKDKRILSIGNYEDLIEKSSKFKLSLNFNSNDDIPTTPRTLGTPPSSTSTQKTGSNSPEQFTYETPSLSPSGLDSISRFEAEFSCLDVIGHGGFGTVYRAKNYLDQKEYAIKRIKLPFDTSSVQIILREVRNLALLEHKSIVRYYCSWTENLPEDKKVIVGESEHDECNGDCDDDEISESHIETFQFDDIKNPHSASSDNNIIFSEFSREKELSKSRRDRIKFNDNSDPCKNSDSMSNELSHPVRKRNSSACYTPPKREFLIVQMELCQSTSLKDWLNEHRTDRSAAKCLEIYQDLAGAVQYLHSKNVIHRDMKPSNVLFSYAGRIKLADFGLSVIKTSNNEFKTVSSFQNLNSLNFPSCEQETVLSSRIGTELYMSPEIAEGKKHYDHRVDVYSLGIIFLELLHPFDTEMERITLLRALKQGQFPLDWAENNQDEMEYVSWLLLPADQRPFAKEITENDLFQRIAMKDKYKN